MSTTASGRTSSTSVLTDKAQREALALWLLSSSHPTAVMVRRDQKMGTQQIFNPNPQQRRTILSHLFDSRTDLDRLVRDYWR